MRNIYCIKCNKNGKFKSPKISYIFDKTLVSSITYDTCGSKYKTIVKQEDLIEIITILGLTKNMV